jgi:hypothetical protein
MRTMRTVVAVVVIGAAGCGHTKEAEVISAVEPEATIGFSFTADTTRLQSGAATNEAGVKALRDLLADQLAVVGQLRADRTAADHLDVIADLPAPGWALRARIRPNPELLCQVSIEPVALEPAEHTVRTAPWSVQDAFDQVRRRATTLQPAKVPPMEPARFARLRAEATAAAAEGRDPLLSPADFVRIPRPITSEGVDRPYYVPPVEPSTLK